MRQRSSLTNKAIRKYLLFILISIFLLPVGCKTKQEEKAKPLYPLTAEDSFPMPEHEEIYHKFRTYNLTKEDFLSLNELNFKIDSLRNDLDYMITFRPKNKQELESIELTKEYFLQTIDALLPQLYKFSNDLELMNSHEAQEMVIPLLDDFNDIIAEAARVTIVYRSPFLYLKRSSFLLLKPNQALRKLIVYDDMPGTIYSQITKAAILQARADGTLTKGILGTQIGARSKKIDDFYFELADKVQTLYQALEFTRGIDAGVTDKDFYQFIIEYDNNEDSLFFG